MKRLMLAAALAASGAFAQGMPKPPEELKAEQWFAGSWTCKGHMNAGPMGPAQDTHNRIDFKMELGGFWLQYKGTALAGPMKGKEIFDGFSSWDGSAHQRYDFAPGSMVHFTSKGWDGDKLVFEGEMTSGGNKVPAKETITRKGEASFTTALEMGGATAMEETCTKAAKPASAK